MIGIDRWSVRLSYSLGSKNIWTIDHDIQGLSKVSGLGRFRIIKGSVWVCFAVVWWNSWFHGFLCIDVNMRTGHTSVNTICIYIDIIFICCEITWTSNLDKEFKLPFKVLFWVNLEQTDRHLEITWINKKKRYQI